MIEESPRKLTTAAGNAPVPLLLIVAPPAVELSKKLMPAVAFELFRMAVPPVDVLKNSINAPEPLLLTVAAPAVLVPLKLVNESAPLLAMTEFPAVELTNVVDDAEPVLLRRAEEAEAPSLNNV